MGLTGEAKKEYQKEYMRKKRKLDKEPFMSFKEWLKKEGITEKDRKRDPFDCDWYVYLARRTHYENTLDTSQVVNYITSNK